MITLTTISDLHHFGVEYLTSESCNLNMRGLYDLNEEGAELIRKFFGLPYNCALQPNWNYVSPTIGEHVASVLMGRETAYSFMEFAARVKFHDRTIIIDRTHGVLNRIHVTETEKDMTTIDNFMAARLEGYERLELYKPRVTKDTRNKHQMSGRIA